MNPPRVYMHSQTQPLWRTVWRFLKKLQIELPYDPAIPLLGIYTEETRIERSDFLKRPVLVHKSSHTLFFIHYKGMCNIHASFLSLNYCHTSSKCLFKTIHLYKNGLVSIGHKCQTKVLVLTQNCQLCTSFQKRKYN